MTAASILIVDDEPTILKTLAEVLTDEGHQVLTAATGTEALTLASQAEPAVALLDIWLPDLDGLTVLARLMKSAHRPIVIMMSGHASIETAVKATKLGAYDYLEKPLSLERVTLVVRRALREHRLEEENLALKQRLTHHFEMVGDSASMRRLREEIVAAARASSPVLITGETGVGKELVARAIHQASARAQGPFVEVNCAAIPESLIESELFSHEKGAFTGAVATKPGRFELAHEGTLFLDEVADMSPGTQAKVLRVIQEQRFTRVGGTKPIQVNVRLISASNRQLLEEIQRGTFRDDLYYRLNVIPIHIPPLRERREDIPALVQAFAERLTQEHGLREKKIAPEVLSLLMEHDWPGNIRELKNLIERLMIMVPRQMIVASDLSSLTPSATRTGSEPAEGRSFKEAREAWERRYLLLMLREHGWNVTKTAAALKIERSHLHQKLKALGISLRGIEA